MGGGRPPIIADISDTVEISDIYEISEISEISDIPEISVGLAISRSSEVTGIPAISEISGLAPIFVLSASSNGSSYQILGGLAQFLNISTQNPTTGRGTRERVV